VVFSGTAVAIGLALMLFMPLPFMRGFGLAGLLIPLVSVLAAVTILPVLLYWLEDRLDRVRLVPRKVAERRDDPVNGFWPRLARTIMRRPAAFAGATTVGCYWRRLRCSRCSSGPAPTRGSRRTWRR
jgi:RND superfamily putative drug exporter